MTDHTITGSDLRNARRMLRKQAGKEFPELVAVDKPGQPSLEAALQAVDIEVDSTIEFCYSLIDKNRPRLAKAGITTKEQYALYAAAIGFGITLGVEVATDD